MLEVALVGTGRMGQLRAPMLYANPRANLACVVDVVEAAGARLAAQFHCGKCHENRTRAEKVALVQCCIRQSAHKCISSC